RRIKDGTTISYAELASRIGKPKAVRAAGLANGQNPISIVVPCHRVIGSNGSLTGYGGGLQRQKWALAPGGGVLRQNDTTTGRRHKPTRRRAGGAEPRLHRLGAAFRREAFR